MREETREQEGRGRETESHMRLQAEKADAGRRWNEGAGGGLLYPWRLILQAPFKAAKGKLDAMPSKGHIKNNDLNGTIIYNPANATNPWSNWAAFWLTPNKIKGTHTNT